MRRTSRDIRTANRCHVLRHAIAHSPVSRSRLAAATGLSPATVATLVGELLGLGMLVEAGYEDSGGGRPRGLLAVDPRGGALVGVELTATSVHVEVVDLALRVLARGHEERARSWSDPAAVAARIARVLRAATARAGNVRVLGAGVGVPGTVDAAGRVSVTASDWGWRDVPLRALLGEHLPYPVCLDSPLRACVVAELWFGAARGRDDAVVIGLGTGVGAGLAFGGTPHRGLTGSAGEWGHSTLEPDGRPCRCGRHGCVEAYVGAPGIVRTWRELTGDGAASLPGLAAACRAGDPVALTAVRRTADRLGAAVADLVNLLDPEVVILTGRVARALGQALLAPLGPAVARHLVPRDGPGAEIVLSPLATNPVSLGAAALALEGVLGTVPAVR